MSHLARHVLALQRAARSSASRAITSLRADRDDQLAWAFEAGCALELGQGLLDLAPALRAAVARQRHEGRVGVEKGLRGGLVVVSQIPVSPLMAMRARSARSSVSGTSASYRSSWSSALRTGGPAATAVQKTSDRNSKLFVNRISSFQENRTDRMAPNVQAPGT